LKETQTTTSDDSQTSCNIEKTSKGLKADRDPGELWRDQRCNTEKTQWGIERTRIS